jgi:hypothetical protein
LLIGKTYQGVILEKHPVTLISFKPLLVTHRTIPYEVKVKFNHTTFRTNSFGFKNLKVGQKVKVLYSPNCLKPLLKYAVWEQAFWKAFFFFMGGLIILVGISMFRSKEKEVFK